MYQSEARARDVVAEIKPLKAAQETIMMSHYSHTI